MKTLLKNIRSKYIYLFIIGLICLGIIIDSSKFIQVTKYNQQLSLIPVVSKANINLEIRYNNFLGFKSIFDGVIINKKIDSLLLNEIYKSDLIYTFSPYADQQKVNTFYKDNSLFKDNNSIMTHVFVALYDQENPQFPELIKESLLSLNFDKLIYNVVLKDYIKSLKTKKDILLDKLRSGNNVNVSNNDQAMSDLNYINYFQDQLKTNLYPFISINIKREPHNIIMSKQSKIPTFTLLIMFMCLIIFISHKLIVNEMKNDKNREI